MHTKRFLKNEPTVWKPQHSIRGSETVVTVECQQLSWRQSIGIDEELDTEARFWSSVISDLFIRKFDVVSQLNTEM